MCGCGGLGPEFKVLGLVGLALLSYGWGVVSASRQLPPYAWALTIKGAWGQPHLAPTSRHPTRFAFDVFGRLVGDRQKLAVPCPAQSARTAVLLLAGQSNAANHGGQRMTSEHGRAVVNFFEGTCYTAASPLLGASGIGGEVWTPLANMLVASGVFDRVVLAPVAIGGTDVARWVSGGDLGTLLIGTATDLAHQGYRATHVLWHQGETDVQAATSQEVYTQRLLSVAASLRAQGIDAPILVSVASKCLLMAPHNGENAVARAQRLLPEPGAGLFAGVDSDALLLDVDRYDACHFSASGQTKIAAAWARRIAAVPAR